MSYFVIIRGPAGVGKSVISRLVARKIHAETINFDKIMKELELDYIPGDKWIPLAKFLKADKIMMPKFKEKLERKKRIIFDGNFYHRKHISNLIDNLDLPNFVFTLKANLKECIKRDKTRGDKLGQQAIIDVFKLVSAFDYGIIINTNGKSPADIAKKILFCLPKLS